MNTRIRLQMLGFAGALSACAQTTIEPASFQSAYQPMLAPQETVLPKRCVAVSGITYKNGLENTLVGKRFLENHKKPPEAIHMTGNLSDWVRASATEMFRRAGFNTQDPSAPRLTLQLTDIAVSENIYVNSGYNGRVTLDATLLNAQGQPCWNDTEAGLAQNYGHSGSAINYQETVNHALDRALMALLADKNFQKAACGACRP